MKKTRIIKRIYISIFLFLLLTSNSFCDNSNLKEHTFYKQIDDFIINFKPSEINRPFHENDQEHKVTNITPESENIYFNNPKLIYSNLNLKEINANYFINKTLKEINSKNTKLTSKPLSINDNETLNLSNLTINYKLQLPDNRSTDFYFNNRQWFKKFEEATSNIYVHNKVLIFRNDFNIFFHDILSGILLNKFETNLLDKNENYFTIRHPHTNAYGTELLINNNNIYTSLNGKLFSLNIENILSIKTIWEKALGEYYISAAPIVVKNKLIVGLSNSKGEFWIVGFNKDNGKMLFSNCIGLATNLSLASNLSITEENSLYILTNLGIFLSINTNNGNINWVRKYDFKRYKLLDYYLNNIGKYTPYLKKAIEFDTSFIKIINNKLFVKPRESSQLYISDLNTGEEIKTFTITNGYIINSTDTVAITLSSTSSKDKYQINAIDINTSKIIDSRIINYGKLLSTFQESNTYSIIQVENTIYSINFKNDLLEIDEISSKTTGTLKSIDKNYSFSIKNQEINVQINDSYLSNSIYSDLTRKRKAILKLFSDTIKDTDTKSFSNNLTNILNNIETLRIPVDDIASIILSNITQLKNSKWFDFFKSLNKIYDLKSINYHDIDLLFKNLLIENGLLEKPGIQGKVLLNNPEIKSFNIHGGSRLNLVKINNITNSDVDIILLIENNQLICINESGNILWTKSIFYDPPNRCSNIVKHNQSPYSQKLNTYLFNKTLIIEDGINLIAVDAINGNYIWSKSINTIDFKPNEPRTNDSEHLRKTSENFQYNILNNLSFSKNALFIFNNQALYKINPETGFCTRKVRTNTKEIDKIILSDDFIYLYSRHNKTFISFDYELLNQKEHKIETDNDLSNTEILIKNDNIILYDNRKIYLISLEDDVVSDFININYQQETLTTSIEENNANFIAIISSLKNINSEIISFKLSNNKIEVNWKINLITDQLTDRYTNKNFYFGSDIKHYYIDKDKIIIPVMDGLKTHTIKCIRIADGETLWSSTIDPAKGFFFNISNIIKHNDKIIFTYTTSGGEEVAEEYKNFIKSVFYSKTFSYLIKLDYETGKILQTDELYGYNTFSHQKHFVIETKNLILYNLYGTYIYAILKND